eukprot:CAMPEP_0114595780 /NCGR_PEP_ID=MMETSP0125-20121206/17686_1 /TAXON_ID=485358 ORGANISM="Aristerostoma sp., Strain ATCC 50986" /NCGR_SAMPLE_ID=MMETSP0125 /ASSEMBLY_ACC=CAM_ASM_000245 /LENGTH=115 /DNA_ID=CAMNT_0001797925 /DNA_START=201 /DNA_END=548 /DNA_ORIENTATION=+
MAKSLEAKLAALEQEKEILKKELEEAKKHEQATSKETEKFHTFYDIVAQKLEFPKEKWEEDGWNEVEHSYRKFKSHQHVEYEDSDHVRSLSDLYVISKADPNVECERVDLPRRYN